MIKAKMLDKTYIMFIHVNLRFQKKAKACFRDPIVRNASHETQITEGKLSELYFAYRGHPFIRRSTYSYISKLQQT